MVRARKDGDHEERGRETEQNKEGKGHETGRGEKEGAMKNDYAGSRGGSWPGGAGARDQPMLPSLAQPPVWCSCLTQGRTMRSVLPWGCGKINGVQDKRSKKLFVLLSRPDGNGQGPIGHHPRKAKLAGSVHVQDPAPSHYL